MFDDVKSVFDSTVFRLVGVVKLKEVLEDLEIVEDAVISQEMHHVQVTEAQLFLFVLLLIFQDEVVKKNFVKAIDVFFNQELDSFDGGFFVVFEASLFSIKLFDDVPELFEGVAAQRRRCVSLFGLKFFFLESFPYVFIDFHILFDEGANLSPWNVNRLLTYDEIVFLDFLFRHFGFNVIVQLGLPF